MAIIHEQVNSRLVNEVLSQKGDRTKLWEDPGPNMKQTRPDQSVPSTAAVINYLWTLGEMRKRKERMKNVTKGRSRSGRFSTSHLTSPSQHKPSYVTTAPPTVSCNVTFKAAKFPFPAARCSSGFLWLAASRRQKEELISGNSCCCWAWIPALFQCASLCRNFPHSPAQRRPQGSEHL